MVKFFLIFILLIPFNAEAQSSALDFADKLYANGNYTKAIETYKSLKNVEEVYSKIAKSYIALGHYDKGLEYYKKASIAYQEDELTQYEYAKLLAKTKKYKEAHQLLKRLIESDSLNPNYHYELGIVLEKQRDTTAVNEFTKAFELDETHQKAIFNIAKHYLKRRKFDTVHQFVDKGLESYENNIKLISLKAQAYYHQDYFTHAVVWFKKLLDLGEKSEFIHEKLSLSYAQNSDYEDAIFHRKEALKYNPFDASAMFVIGTYYERLSNYEKAEEYISKSIKLQDVSLSKEYQRLGTIYNRQKKYEKAIKTFQKSLKEDPSNINAEFFILVTKEAYYEGKGAKIKVYEDYLKKYKTKKSPFKIIVEDKLRRLKEEKFLEED